MRVALVDDSKTNISIMCKLLTGINATPLSFSDSRIALRDVPQCGPDLVVVDFQMPHLSGLDLISHWRDVPGMAEIPIVMITASDEVAVRHAALEMGATDFIPRPIDPIEVKARLRNLLHLREAQKKLADRADWLAKEVAAATAIIAAREEEIILRLARAAEYRDTETGSHILRMARYSELIATGLGLPPATCRLIYLAAPLHDIGKIGVPDSILLKPGSLSSEERKEIEKHASVGEAILEGSASELIQLAREIAGSHHERWDGIGYPRGTRGSEIPLAGRIAAIADVFDALTSERPYKKAWSLDEARQYIVKHSGSHFDPECVTAFLREWNSIRSIRLQGRPEAR